MVDDIACHRVDTSNEKPFEAPESLEYGQSFKKQGLSHCNFDTDTTVRSLSIDPVTNASLHSVQRRMYAHNKPNDFAEERKCNGSVASGEQSHGLNRHQSEMLPVKVPPTTLSTSSAASHSSEEESKCPDVVFIQQSLQNAKLPENEQEVYDSNVVSDAIVTPIIRREPELLRSQSSIPPLEVRCYGRTRVPTPHGEVFCHLYRNNYDNKEHMALVIDPSQNNPSIQARQKQGLLSNPRHLRSRSLDAVWHKDETTIERLVRGAYVNRLSDTYQVPSEPIPIQSTDALDPNTPSPLVRIHSECYTGETIGSQRCDCGEQLDEALRIISTSVTHSSSGMPVPPRGVVVYMRQEGRGIGLLDKLLAYNLQDMGHDTVSANILLGHLPDARRYDISSAILRDLGIDQCRLLTNNPEKIQSLEAEGIRVTERVSMIPRIWKLSHHTHASHKARRCRRAEPTNRVDDMLARSDVHSLTNSTMSQGFTSNSDVLDTTQGGDVLESDDSTSSHDSLAQRSLGATLVGGSTTRGNDLERYLRTKIERMGHLLSEPVHSKKPIH
ncbi:GTP cyclohydrolase II [Malassezia arunalokei]|uniref:GTP cyclohydrolase II n=1 Tax=Malassezia arunalokei TaxID=1514897 RepID=A0AAJ5Z4P5_9BASI|nr:GTP cyclohydrolase II [Malassezia arunalokei]